jgi:hypothetical protein
MKWIVISIEVASELGIAITFFFMAWTLLKLAKRVERFVPDNHRWIAVCFSMLLAFNSVDHIIRLVDAWIHDYWLVVVWRLATLVISIMTAYWLYLATRDFYQYLLSSKELDRRQIPMLDRRFYKVRVDSERRKEAE